MCTDHSQTLTQLETLKEKQMLRSVSVNCDKVFTSAQLLRWYRGGREGEWEWLTQAEGGNRYSIWLPLEVSVDSK